MKKKDKNNLKITLIRSFIGKPDSQIGAAFGLGLKKINQSVVREDIPVIRGMINKIPHMLKVEKTKEG